MTVKGCWGTVLGEILQTKFTGTGHWKNCEPVRWNCWKRWYYKPGDAPHHPDQGNGRHGRVKRSKNIF